MLALVWKRTTWICVGVPASAVMNAVTAFLTWTMSVSPIEFDSSTTRVMGPPHRLCVGVNVGAFAMLGTGSVLRVVPPAVMLIWLMPPPRPEESPPPLMVTTTRLAFLLFAYVTVVSPGSTMSGGSGALTWSTQDGTVTPRTNTSGGGGPGRSCRTLLTSHVHGPPSVDWHSMRTRSKSPSPSGLKWYETLVVTVTVPLTVDTSSVQLSISAFDPVRSPTTLAGHPVRSNRLTLHGEASGRIDGAVVGRRQVSRDPHADVLLGAGDVETAVGVVLLLKGHDERAREHRNDRPQHDDADEQLRQREAGVASTPAVGLGSVHEVLLRHHS